MGSSTNLRALLLWFLDVKNLFPGNFQNLSATKLQAC